MDLHELPVSTLNIRWLAWTKDRDASKWPTILEQLTRKRISKGRAAYLLKGLSLQDGEVDVLADMAGVEVEEFGSVPLYLRGSTILVANLQYLLNEIPHGRKKLAAREIGVTAEQLSRWGKGNFTPHPANLRKLLKYHGADPDMDLTSEPIFLSMEPISVFAQRTWLLTRVEEMRGDEIAAVFPALKKIFRYDEPS